MMVQGKRLDFSFQFSVFSFQFSVFSFQFSVEGMDARRWSLQGGNSKALLGGRKSQALLAGKRQ